MIPQAGIDRAESEGYEQKVKRLRVCLKLINKRRICELKINGKYNLVISLSCIFIKGKYLFAPTQSMLQSKKCSDGKIDQQALR